MSSTIQSNCLECNKEFKTAKGEVSRGNGKFCCTSCSSIYAHKNRPKPANNVTCALCKKSFYKNATKIKASKSGLYFCCRAHKDEAQKIGGIKEIMPPHYGTANGLYSYRKTALDYYPNKCSRCSYDDEPRILMVHHKNRDRQNNNVSNLEVLCPTCHELDHFLSGDGRWGSPA